MHNRDIRQALKNSGIKHWQAAAAMGISEATMVRRLRQELPEEEKARIFQIIKVLKSRAS